MFVMGNKILVFQAQYLSEAAAVEDGYKYMCTIEKGHIYEKSQNGHDIYALVAH